MVRPTRLFACWKVQSPQAHFGGTIRDSKITRPNDTKGESAGWTIDYIIMPGIKNDVMM
jgi:hypothetical protein